MSYFCFYDTETTGTDPAKDDIISLGCVVTQYDQVSRCFRTLNTFHTYINPDRDIPAAAVAVHGITPEMLFNQPTFGVALSAFSDYLQPLKGTLFLLAHNGRNFDDVIMYCNAVKHQVVFSDFLERHRIHGFIDTLVVLRKLFAEAPEAVRPKDQKTGRFSFELGHCHHSWCGKPIEGAHDALVDAVATVAIMNAPCVSARYNVYSLLKLFMVPTEKALKWVRQQGGLRFQQLESETLQQQQHISGQSTQIAMVSCSSQPSWANSTDAPLPLASLTTKEEDIDMKSALSDTEASCRICLNCMCFIKLQQEHICQLMPQSVVTAQARRSQTQQKAVSVLWTDSTFLQAQTAEQASAPPPPTASFPLSVIRAVGS
jgi:DNA polymerase III epsilon subunit-like protein